MGSIQLMNHFFSLEIIQEEFTKLNTTPDLILKAGQNTQTVNQFVPE
jgi:hypothetical protein